MSIVTGKGGHFLGDVIVLINVFLCITSRTQFSGFEFVCLSKNTGHKHPLEKKKLSTHNTGVNTQVKCVNGLTVFWEHTPWLKDYLKQMPFLIRQHVHDAVFSEGFDIQMKGPGLLSQNPSGIKGRRTSSRFHTIQQKSGSARSTDIFYLDPNLTYRFRVIPKAHGTEGEPSKVLRIGPGMSDRLTRYVSKSQK